MNATIDLYALGMVLYLVYNGGQGPFAESQEGAEARRLKGEALPPPAYADYEMAAIILKAAAFRPEDRWQSPEAMGQALVSYMQRNPVNDSVIAAPIVTAPTLDAEAAALDARAESLALGSNWYFRLWNLLALLVLLPVHAIGLSGAASLPWFRPAMLWERFCLLLSNLFGGLGAFFAALTPTGNSASRSRRLPAILFGGTGAVILLCILVPVLASGDALFAAVTADLRIFVRSHFTLAITKLVCGMALTPFVFGFLYRLRHPKPLTRSMAGAPTADPLGFVLILAALDALYLLFLAVQSTGILGGEAYLAQRGISYAQWARSGFFQMVGVTVVNLTAILTALWAARPNGRLWTVLRSLSALLLAESLVLLGCAAWRMTLYVQAYGLSFKRCLTYWGMVMMALFFLTAAAKLIQPSRSFCRIAFPLALAGWLVLNCIPVDFLVAKNQVDRYLNGESPTISVHYLAYSLSYDTLSQLERLDPDLPLSRCEGEWWSSEDTVGSLLTQRRNAAREECADWHTWSLSAFLASR